MTDQTPLYPLEFQPIYKEKVWGGRSLAKLGRTLPGGADTPIGESWELADLGATSASGGGGGAERSVVANGPLAGRTLHELIQAYGRAILGDVPLTPDGGFPLLVKYLDAQQHLSVQVHPSPAYAAEHPGAHLKSEAWYILDAEPDAVIYKGVREGVTPEQFARAIEDDAVEPLLIKVPVKPDDCHYLPSGTCHALGAGLVVAEVQTPSDTTFRVYDWGRAGRELHVEQALACIEFGPARTEKFELQSVIRGEGFSRQRVVACEHFRVERVEASSSLTEPAGSDQPVIWMVLLGSGELSAAGGRVTPIRAGQTLLLPPGMHDASVGIEPGTVWLEVSFPQAQPARLA